MRIWDMSAASHDDFCLLILFIYVYLYIYFYCVYWRSWCLLFITLVSSTIWAPLYWQQHRNAQLILKVYFIFLRQNKYNLGLKWKDVNFLTFFGTNSNQFLNFISFKTTSQLKDVFALWDKTLQRFDSNLENEILNKDLVWAFYSFVLNI